MNKRKFLFLIYSLHGGGAERVTSVLCSSLAKQGHEVHLGLYHRTDGDYPISDDVQIHMLKEDGKGSKIKNSLFRIKQTEKIIKDIKPDFTVGLMGTVLFESFIASLFKRTAFISAVRIDPAQHTEKKLQRYLMLFVNYFSTAVFVQNNMQKEYYPEFIQKKVFAVFNPVSEVFIQNSHHNSGEIRKIATSGRLTGQKNHKMLIDAVEIVLKKYPDVSLTIYGEGKMQDELNNYISDKHLEKNISLYGRTNNMMAELMKNDLFVLSSNYEGMPNVLLEAMALGMPCISTDCRTGPSEMIDNYKNGILVPVGDADKMADAICYMIEHSDDAHIMGNSAREFVTENCTVDIITGKFSNECERFRKKGK